MSLRWLPPSVAFMIATGLVGITTKLALKHVRWQEVVAWTALAYVCVAGLLSLTSGVRLGLGPGNGWAAVSGLLAVGGIVALSLALRAGSASQVVPVTAAYPVLTVIVARVVLKENVTATGLVGMVLVVAGVILLALQRAG